MFTDMNARQVSLNTFSCANKYDIIVLSCLLTYYYVENFSYRTM